eukprot:4948046-Ditylum_brightwellii.AAC.1
MAYRRYSNLRERFRRDYASKLSADIESLDFMTCPCNCNRTSQVNGSCAFQGYMQDTFKKRMTQQISDITCLISTKKPSIPKDDQQCSDTFAKQFAKKFPVMPRPINYVKIYNSMFSGK